MQIMTRRDRTLTIDLLNREGSARATRPQNSGNISIHAEESISSKTTVEMILSCPDLEYKDLFSRSVGPNGFFFIFSVYFPFSG